MLLVATAAIAAMSELLVGALEGFTAAVGLPATCVGLIIIPIVGNAAEHASAVTFALKAKMERAVGIALGSALQIALLVAPLLVLRVPLELTALIGAVFIGNAIARDGETHWYEGIPAPRRLRHLRPRLLLRPRRRGVGGVARRAAPPIARGGRSQRTTAGTRPSERALASTRPTKASMNRRRKVRVASLIRVPTGSKGVAAPPT